MPVELPAYLRVLWSYRPFVVASAVFAVLVALVVHFTVEDGALELRADREYRSSVTVLLGGGPKNPYVAELPGAEREPGVQQDQIRDLSSTAVIYAYLVSGEAVRSAVASQLGPLEEGDAIGGVRRTTQPMGDEKNGGRFTLPILSIVGTSLDPERAVALSRAATSVFLEQVAAQQEADGIPADIRVTLTVTDEGAAVPGDVGTVAIPIALTGLAAFLLGLVGIFVGHGVRLSRARRAAAATEAPGPRRRGAPASAEREKAVSR